MPYKSDDQRKFFHTDTAKKAGITDKEVNEFDQASKGMKLPEHSKKMAFGGETNPKHETVSAMENNPSAGFYDGGPVNDPDVMAALAAIAASSAGDEKQESDMGNPVTAVVVEPEDHMQHYDTGTGDVEPLDDADATAAMIAGGNPQQSGLTRPTTIGPTVMPAPQPQINPLLMSALTNAAKPVTAANIPQMGLQTPPPQPAPTNGTQIGLPIPPGQQASQAPAIGQLMQKLQQTPNTNYDFYKNMSAEDRAALLQKLTAQQHSGGNLAASAAGGLGDAIARSFGHQNTNYQENIQNEAQKAKEEKVGAMDTERQQKLQDMQANLGLQENDPASPYSSGMRQFVTAFTGKQVPSGVSASQLKGAFSDIAKIFDSQLVAAAAQTGHKVEAGKAVADESFFNRLADMISGSAGGKAQAALSDEASGGNGSPAATPGWSVVKGK